MLFRKVDKELKDRIESLKEWYYYINFDGIEVRRDLKRDKASSLNNWNNCLKYCIPDVRDKRIMDIGCNAGLYDLEIAKLGAREVIGLDLDMRQAVFTKDFFSKKWQTNFSNINFIQKNVKDSLPDLGRFDFACIFCAVYHFTERIDFVIEEVSKITDTLVLQGNLRRLNSPKYRDRIGTESAGIEGMAKLLKRHGFGRLHIFNFKDYPKPVVIGEK